MNNALWKNIQEFDFEKPLSEYGFSVRLAKENYWTRNFTEKAILEYKKFMYLAATSDFMVSPSEIVDVVWHQHLIFTQSYQEFCLLLGKQVQHIPSTHNRADFQKFQMAKVRTMELYEKTFGEQPSAIWNYSDMYESLKLTKADYKIRSVIIAAILAFIALIVPFYFLLRPLYVTIGNPNFLFLYLMIILATFIILENHNKRKLRKLVLQFNSDSFVFDLHPAELIYMNTKKIENVINGYVERFINAGYIKITPDYLVEKVSDINNGTPEGFLVDDTFKTGDKKRYSLVLHSLTTKPLFTNVINWVGAFSKYITKSKKFTSLFYLNLSVLLMLTMLGTIRLITGVVRDKPVLLITLFILILIALIVLYLRRLTMQVCAKIVPAIYKKEFRPSELAEVQRWEWKYFLIGEAFLAAPFLTLENKERNWSGDSGSGSGGSDSSSSCGSSCGSSCSSCGGCGGD